MAELRRRHVPALRLEVAAGLRARAEEWAVRDGVPYEFSGAPLVRRAERLERGLEPVHVQGFELPRATRSSAEINPSNPYVLHPDGRLTEWQPGAA